MSRIGILPIDIPAGVTIEVDKENLVTVNCLSILLDLLT